MRIESVRRWCLGLAMGALLAWCPKAEAAAYIKFDGIDGEAKGGGHEKWIELESVSLVQMQGRPGGGCGASPSVSEIVVTKQLDASTPDLQQAACMGGMIPRATIHVHGGGGAEPYLQYELENVLISSYSLGSSSSSSGEALPVESMSLNFTTIDVEVVTDRHR